MTVSETEQAVPLEATGGRPAIGLVSVIVPHLDDYDNLDTCLKMLEAQSFPGDRTEIIVVDNGSYRASTRSAASSDRAPRSLKPQSGAPGPPATRG